jgi:tetratricopeptide (TPR) repeat protein
LARDLTSLAIHYSSEMEETRKGEELFRESLEVWQDLRKEFPDDPDLASRNAWAHWWLGVSYLTTDRHREAEPELRGALALREKLLESRPNSLELLQDQAHNKAYLADLLVGTGRPAEAERLLREAIAFRERMIANYPKYYEHWRRLVIEQQSITNCLLALGRPEEAEQMSRKCLANSKKLAADFPDAPGTSNSLGEAYDSLGRLLQDTDRPQEAGEAFRQAKRCFEEAVVKAPEARSWFSPAYALTWFLADCPATQFRDPERAANLAKHALQVTPQSGHYWLVLGVAQYRTGKLKDAIASLKKSMEILAGGGSGHWFILAMAHRQLGNEAEARKWYDQAVGWMEKSQPRDEQWRRYRAEAAELLGVKEKK